MSQSSLTAKYRPQTFADVAGQQTVCEILARACEQDKVAPAYLFSGTRGVGKTTIARIMAKAVNCKEAPTSEPCNKCSNCLQITQGAAVDVIEIDGASNRGIDDARRIREDIGYAPMECRYKVFIIDEAHMLTREAFNALLKTLEEPPRNVTFILATTEHHKFPATIISRCQHYAFKRLTQPQLYAHLEKILQMETVEFDPKALQLIARRAAGSVRDSMSLLGQVLALGRERLEMDDARNILGLAGQEIFFRVLGGVKDQNPIALADLLHEVLDQGLDLGFFLRELSQVWRNLFLLKQAGDKALPMLELEEDEAAQWTEWANSFDLTHIHACWQLTLEGQRRVLTSLDPALALELLLLNLAFLPSLVSLTAMPQAQAAPQGGQQPAPRPAPAAPRPQPAPMPQQGGFAQGPPPGFSQGPSQGFSQDPGYGPAPGPAPAQQNFGQAPAGPASPAGPPQAAPAPYPQATMPPQPGMQPAPAPQQMPAPQAPPQQAQYQPQAPAQTPSQAPGQTLSQAPGQTLGQQAAPPPGGPKNWQGFLRYAQSSIKGSPWPQRLRQAKGEFDADNNSLTLHCLNEIHCSMLEDPECWQWILSTAKLFFGDAVSVALQKPEEEEKKKDFKSIQEDVINKPIIQRMQDEFGARVVSSGTMRKEDPN